MNVCLKEIETRTRQSGGFVLSHNGEYDGMRYAMLTCDTPSIDFNHACIYNLYDDSGECIAIGQCTGILYPFGTHWAGWIWKKGDLVMRPYIPLQLC